MHDPLQVHFDRSKLSPWHFAVSWARIQLEQKIEQFKGWGFTTSYDEIQLERLLDLEQFLKMTWDERMEALTAAHTAQEVK
jgi:hypothetical protein